ncbi:copine family protein 2-like isoform X2 [Ruditapes philippinarum]|uniref:copine family protein 2-like isoform X2 n=1 Tax=Ruditapes philippinarum TaxID=129788 RepID=UPI00295C1B58|nr:copine family protein 2-like isoform X2 [Ruditapes philippinarum]
MDKFQNILKKQRQSVENVTPLYRFHSLSEVSKAIKDVGVTNCGLIFGIDYTKENIYNGKVTFNKRSLHDVSKQRSNPYQEVICILGETLEPLDDDGIIPTFGFGGTVEEEHGTFPLKDEGNCEGFLDVLETYNKFTPSRTLGGPSNFAPLIEKAINIVQRTKQYHILVIVCTGKVDNEEETIESIVKASNFPLSIVVIGVGDGPWTAMNHFDDKLPSRLFDNFQFVEFHKIKSEARNPHAAIALATLMEIPDQFTAIQKLKLFDNLT